MAVRHPRAQVGLVVLLALLLRLGHVLLYDHWPAVSGGDYAWYASNGRLLVQTGQTPGPLPTGPLFVLVAGYAGQIQPLDPGGGQALVRVLHAFLSALTVWMVYRIGQAAWTHAVGLAAALALAIGPAFIIEAGNLTTETMAIFLTCWALALWLERIRSPDGRLMAATGSLLALAALTRSVLLAFPLVPLSHLLLRYGLRRALRQGIVLIAALLFTLSPWTVYNLVQWHRFTLTGEGLLGTLYVGAVGWKDPAEVDAELGFEGSASPEGDYQARQEAFAQGIAEVVLSDPLGYLARRGVSLAGALLQPHNTVFYPGESIKTLVLDWLRDDRSLGGLATLTGADAFWPKLLLYAFHYAALIFGVAGLILNRRRWRSLWPLYAAFGYFLGIHLVLDAIPRYLFPLEPLWWLFAAATVRRYNTAR